MEKTLESNLGIIWHTEKRKLGELLPASYNPRHLTSKQYEDLKSSLQRFSLVEIPAINTDNILLAGHMRTKVMADVYGTDHEIEVRVPNRTLTEDECKEYNIRSNKNTGEWDFDLLANNFSVEDLMEYGFQEFELGFMREMEPVMDQDDLTKTLDSYLDGNIKQIVLFFTAEDYRTIIDKLSEIMTKENIPDHTAVFMKMLEHYEKTHTS